MSAWKRRADHQLALLEGQGMVVYGGVDHFYQRDTGLFGLLYEPLDEKL